MRRQETAAAAVAGKAERVALLEVRERQRCEREEVAEWRLREEACQRREQEREAVVRRAYAPHLCGLLARTLPPSPTA